MIAAKATKKSLVSPTRNRQDYVEPENRKRIIPAIILLYVFGWLAYLQSFLPHKVVGQDNDAADDKHRASSEPEPEDEEEQLQAAGEVDDDVTGSIQRQQGSSTADAAPRIVLARNSEDSTVTGSPAANLFGPGTGKLTTNTDAFPDLARFVSGGSTSPTSNSPDAKVNIGGGGGSGSGQPELPVRPIDPVPGVIPPDPSRNRAPRLNGPVYLQDTYGCQALLISLLTLLTGATDADGDTLRVVGLTASDGRISQTVDGEWSFSHDAGLLGQVKLSYFITDGQVLVPQVAFLNVVEAPPIVGTSGDDNLLGTNCADTIEGGDGNDNIVARDGNDLIIGGTGDDHIAAGAGNDVIHAGSGNDIVFAGAGNDVVFGGDGNDRIFGEDGDDILMGESGDDFIDGGSGSDIILAGTGNDIAWGGAGNDTIEGNDGDDILHGDGGNDRITAGSGNDTVYGGADNDVIFDGAGSDLVIAGDGNDHVVAAADNASDTYDGGIGSDVLDYSESQVALRIHLADETATGGDIGSDTIRGFESIIGGSGNDLIVAADLGVSIDGAAGNDHLIGGSGNDILADGTGNDIIDAGAGDDMIIAAADAQNDTYNGGTGIDTLSYATATISITIDLSQGRAYGRDIGNDMIQSFEQAIAGSGDDYLNAGKGAATFTGGKGNDTFEFQRDSDSNDQLLVRKITDFTVGDRIIAATYQISYLPDSEAAQQINDLFEDIYLQGNQSCRPVRFHYEQQGGGDYTRVEVHDHSDHYEDFFTIEVAGHHALQFTFNVSGT